MTFYERYVQLCNEVGHKPQSKEMQKIAGVSSPAIVRWKEGSLPNVVPVIKLSGYFGVSIDYLLGVSDSRFPPSLTDEEWMMIRAYRSMLVDAKSDKKEIV